MIAPTISDARAAPARSLGAGRIAQCLGGEAPQAPRAQGVRLYKTFAAAGPQTSTKQ